MSQNQALFKKRDGLALTQGVQGWNSPSEPGDEENEAEATRFRGEGNLKNNQAGRTGRKKWPRGYLENDTRAGGPEQLRAHPHPHPWPPPHQCSASAGFPGKHGGKFSLLCYQCNGNLKTFKAVKDNKWMLQSICAM